MADQSDDRILAVLRWYPDGCGAATVAAVLRANGLLATTSWANGVIITTSWALKRLKRLELEGRVKKVKTSYRAQYKWAAAQGCIADH